MELPQSSSAGLSSSHDSTPRAQTASSHAGDLCYSAQHFLTIDVGHRQINRRSTCLEVDCLVQVRSSMGEEYGLTAQVDDEVLDIM